MKTKKAAGPKARCLSYLPIAKIYDNFKTPFSTIVLPSSVTVLPGKNVVKP